MRVPDVQGPECDYQEGDIIVEHILLKCPQWNTERVELISPLYINNFKRILTTKSGRKAATRFVRRMSGMPSQEDWYLSGCAPCCRCSATFRPFGLTAWIMEHILTLCRRTTWLSNRAGLAYVVCVSSISSVERHARFALGGELLTYYFEVGFQRQLAA